MKIEDLDDIQLLTGLLRGEAEGENFIGKCAVACVARNRVSDRRWPDTYKEVILQPMQFSCFNSLPRQGEILDDLFQKFFTSHEDGWWRECRFAAWGAIFNWYRDFTGGANLYWNPDICTPDWDWDNVQILGKFGKHQFARE